MARVFLACIYEPSVMLSAAAAIGVEGSFVCEANGHEPFCLQLKLSKNFFGKKSGGCFPSC